MIFIVGKAILWAEHPGVYEIGKVGQVLVSIYPSLLTVRDAVWPAP